MTKRQTGFLVALSLTVVALATAFAQQARVPFAGGRAAAHGKYQAPVVQFYHHGPGGCDGGEAAYDGSDL